MFTYGHTLSLHAALPISLAWIASPTARDDGVGCYDQLRPRRSRSVAFGEAARGLHRREWEERHSLHGRHIQPATAHLGTPGGAAPRFYGALRLPSARVVRLPRDDAGGDRAREANPGWLAGPATGAASGGERAVGGTLSGV